MCVKFQRMAVAVATGLLSLTAPLGSLAQPADPKAHVGILVMGGLEQRGHLEQALLQGLREQGYVEGKNLVLERRYTDGQGERMPEFARELAAMKLDAVITTCTPSTRAAREATSSTPIVMAAVADPVGQNLIASLAKPGANITGLASEAEDILPKMMELFTSILPKPATIAVLLEARSDVHPTHVASDRSNRPIAESETDKDRGEESRDVNLAVAFQTAVDEKADAGLVLPDEPVFLTKRARIVGLAAKHNLPAFYGAREYVDEGGLMSYGESLRIAYRNAASYVSKVVRGSKPGEIPVQQPTKFELVINMKTAKALGVTIPQSVSLRADDIVE